MDIFKAVSCAREFEFGFNLEKSTARNQPTLGAMRER